MSSDPCEGFISWELWSNLLRTLRSEEHPTPAIEWRADWNGVLTPYSLDIEEIEKMAQKFVGSTAGRLSDKCPILGAKFWKKGTKIGGIMVREFPTQNGDCYEFALHQSLKVKGDLISPPETGEITVKRVAVGAMKGFGMALAHAGVDKLQNGDNVTITCVGSHKYKNQESDMVDFEVEVVRP